MRAMVLHMPGAPLVQRDLPRPIPGPSQLLVRVEACAVCRTDLHVVDGELPDPVLPLVPGHEIVGIVESAGEHVALPPVGQRVGIAWLGHACGTCRDCTGGHENLCPDARFTGYQLPGGYAEYTVVDAGFCFPIPEAYDAVAAAPLLCAGLIGHRTLAMAGDEATRIGIYGFGAAAHIIAQVLRHQGRQFLAFTRPGDQQAQAFARKLGAAWAGDATTLPDEPLDAALIFAPAGELVPQALRAVRPGGTVVCGGIHMSDIPSFPYSILWGERTIRSVANLTRADGRSFLELAPHVPVRTTTRTYALSAANDALDDLRHGRLDGAAVLVPGLG